MSDTSWVLKGVDPEMREQAAEEAARLGMSLPDYLADILLRTALLEQVSDAQDGDRNFIPAPEQAALATSEAGFSPRHRIEAIERRLCLAVTGFENAAATLDASLVELGARMDEAEGVAGATTGGLATLIEEVGANLIALRKRLADAEDTTEALGGSHEAAYEMFAVRCDRIDERLQILDAVAGDLSEAQEALKHAVADDFSALASESANKLAAGLREVSAAADAAAAQADAAVAHLITELRAVRDNVEQRMSESAADTRARMQAAFSESGERLSALADRVTVNERGADQLRAQLADVEDGAQSALEETADSLRQAGAALAAEFARATHDNRIALESVHADLSSEIAELRERQAGELARIKLIDTAVGNAASEISAVRQLVGGALSDIAAVRDGLSEAEASIAAVYENCDARFAEVEAANRAGIGQLHAELDARFAGVAAREDDRQRAADETLTAFRMETERIEACTLAALDQLSQNIAGGEAALEAKLEARVASVQRAADALDGKLEARLAYAQQSTDALIAEVTQRLETQLQMAQRSADALIADVTQRLDAQLAALHEDHTGAVAHLKLIDRTLSSQNMENAIEAAVSPVKQQLERIESEMGYRPLDRMVSTRLDQLEAATSNAESEQALSILKIQVDAMALQLGSIRIDEGIAQRVDDLRARMSGVESRSSETADRMQGVARLLGRVTEQNASAAAQSEDRLHRVELGLADFRLERAQAAAPPPNTAVEAVAEIAQRMAALEDRQAQTLKSAQDDIAKFIADSEHRFATLDGHPGVGDPALGKAFEALRISVEERILGIELRSVRTLEQVADTVAMLEERLMAGDIEPAAEKAAG